MKSEYPTEISEKLPELSFLTRHRVGFFFIIAFVISWSIWFLSPLVSAGDDTTKLVASLLGAYGPALAAILISRITTPERTGVNSSRRRGVFVLIFLIVNLIWLLSSEKYGSFDLGNPVLFMFKIIMALVVAFVISGIFSSHKGVHDLLLPLTHWRVKPLWYLVAVLGFPLLIVAGIGLAVLSGVPILQEPLSAQTGSLFHMILGLPLAFFQTMLFQGPLNEEPGWRGFALPELQKRYGALIASVVIGIVWGLWHAPLYFTGIYSSGMVHMLGRLVWTIPLSLLFTWVYNRTGGSLLLTVLLHTSINLQGDIVSLVLRALSG